MSKRKAQLNLGQHNCTLCASRHDHSCTQMTLSKLQLEMTHNLNEKSDCSDRKKKIINSVISHFIDCIPNGRDAKDFIRSAYRTRDSTEIYVALRLPVLRKLLDVNTRKAFRDILDLHGGNSSNFNYSLIYGTCNPF